MDVGGTKAPALLYNGFPGDRSAPVVLGWTLMNPSAHAVGPVFVRGAGETYQMIGRLEPGATITLPEATGTTSSLLAAVRESLLAQGLTTSEAGDFLRAWQPMLASNDGWRVFGFFDQAGIESVSTLTVTPAPGSIHRVMAFAIEP